MLAGLGLGARPAQAAPILHPFVATPDAGVETFSGSFEFDNDVAVIRFVLGEGVFSLSAATTSYAAGGFDPYLSLYYGTQRLTYLTADGETPAENDDTESGLDALLALTLTGAGDYTLALTHSFNWSHAEEFVFDWDLIENATLELFGVSCQPGFLGPECRLPNFSVDVELTRVDTAPVPEPGTLLLMALGTAGAALLRRRRTRHHTKTL